MTPEQKAALPYRPCVGVMLADGQGRVFAAQRNDTDGAAWQMPQGGIDTGEDPRTAALRELEEETGISPDLVRIEAETAGWLRYDLPEDLIGKVWKGRWRGQEQKWVLMRFLGTDRDIDLATEHAEFSDFRWMAPKDLLSAIVPFKRGVYQAAFDELGEMI